MKTQVVFLLIIFILFTGTASSEVYSSSDSDDGISYRGATSALSLPEGHPEITGQANSGKLSPQDNPQRIDAQTLRIEYLNQQLELAKIDFDNKFEMLSKAPSDEYNQASQDIQALKFEMVDLNEELIDLKLKNRQEIELRLQRLYAWSDKIDLLLEKDRLKNGPQARSSRLEVLTLSVEEVKHDIGSITYSIMVEVDNPGERGVASIEVAGKGVDGHIVESKTLKGLVGRQELKTFYDMIIVAPEHALHIISWDVVKTAIH